MRRDAPLRVGVSGDGEAARLANTLSMSANAPLEVRCHDGDERSPAAFAASSDVVITIFEREHEAAVALFGPEGLLEGARTGLKVVELTPASPGFMVELSAKCSAAGANAYGAVLSGASCYVDEALAADADAMALVRSLASHVRVTGGTGSSKAMAIIERLLVGVTATVAEEALALGARAGVSAATLIPLLLKGSGGNEALRKYAARGAQGRPEACEPNFDRALRLGRELGHSVLFGSLARAVCRGGAGGSGPGRRSNQRSIGGPSEAPPIKAVAP